MDLGAAITLYLVVGLMLAVVCSKAEQISTGKHVDAGTFATIAFLWPVVVTMYLLDGGRRR